MKRPAHEKWIEVNFVLLFLTCGLGEVVHKSNGIKLKKGHVCEGCITSQENSRDFPYCWNPSKFGKDFRISSGTFPEGFHKTIFGSLFTVFTTIPFNHEHFGKSLHGNLVNIRWKSYCIKGNLWEILFFLWKCCILFGRVKYPFLSLCKLLSCA